MRRILTPAAILAIAAQAAGVTARPVLATTDVTFAATGAEQTWVVPAGVTAIHVVLIGGHGGTANSQFVFTNPTPGGFGARVVGDLSVAPGSTLYIEVGGAGGMAAGSGTSRGGAGGFNGGAIGGLAGVTQGAGGGGGASDIRTLPRSDGNTLGSRVVVAAGGGGGGATETGSGAGGDADTKGGDAAGAAGAGTGGGAGTATAGGAGGGTGSTAGQSGTAGTGGAGSGGLGGGQGGGGGGGGYFGGGGGAPAAGGGGGSSYLGSAANGSVGVATATVASITISYPVDSATPSPAPSGGPVSTGGPDSGKVDVQFSVTTSGACIELSTNSIDFGSVALGQSNVAAAPDITVTNCGSLSEDVLAHGSDATASGATWSLVSGSQTCADTLGTDEYRLELESTGGTVGLAKSNKTLGTLAAGDAGTHTARLFTACPGSTGAGQLMTTQIVFVATTGG